MNYIDIIEQEEDSSLKVEDPVVSMDLQRTLDFFERHHDPHVCIDNAMTWDV